MRQHVYTDEDATVVDCWQRTHANGEQTLVHLVKLEDEFAAIVYDLDPDAQAGLGAQIISFGATKRTTKRQAKRWMEDNPKGLAPSDDSGGLLSHIVDGLMKLDQSATEQMQDDDGDVLGQMADQQEGQNE